MIRVQGNVPFRQPPVWAVMERQLIDVMNDAVQPVLDKYVREDGSILWPTTDNHTGIDALDDAYESFHNWPLFYAIGGHEKFKALSFRAFDAVTRQFERYDTGFGHPMVVKEYEQGYDWFHQGEGYLFFYMLGLADPYDEKTKARAIRFAGFYNNEDPDVPNFDEERVLIRAPHTGSMGPRYQNFDVYIPWGYMPYKQYYGLPFQDVPGFTSLHAMYDPESATRMGEVMKERMSRGDTAVNLAVTSMMTNAYLYTGDAKYKAWVKAYVEAWMQRARDNQGIIPDNVGLSGLTGEYMNGKWYGGYYGWTWPHGWKSIGDAVTIAVENASLLDRNTGYMALLRSQLDVLIAQGIAVDGTLHVPNKYGDPGNYEYTIWDPDVLDENRRRTDGCRMYKLMWKDGWFEFQPMGAKAPAHLWAITMEQQDIERAYRLQNRHTDEWHRVLPVPAKDQGGHEACWLAYLQGEFPAYPEQILAHNLGQVYQRLAFMREDQQDPSTYKDSYLQRRNPITVEGLVQLTMGCPLPVYNGGLLMAQVRYFDVDKKRPGLPQDVGAMIERLTPEGVVLQLVNLGALEPRHLVVQAGAYGEHQFTAISYECKDGDAVKHVEERIDTPHLRIELAPGSLLKLNIQMNRFVNDPSYSFPDMDAI